MGFERLHLLKYMRTFLFGILTLNLKLIQYYSPVKLQLYTTRDLTLLLPYKRLNKLVTNCQNFDLNIRRDQGKNIYKRCVQQSVDDVTIS